MDRFEYRTEMVVPGSLDQVYEFFADAGNLELITPPWLHFRIVTPRPIEIRRGTVIDYKLRIRGIPIRWRTEIESWEPGRMFVDRALKSLYRLWRHTHTFEPVEGGVGMVDHVEYAPPLAAITHGLFVRKEIGRIFEYRRSAIIKIFGGGYTE